MKLGMKIAAGFAAILIIAILLGGFCVLSMKNAQIQSNKLAKEFIPSVEDASNFERTVMAQIMLNARSYALSGNESYLELTKKGFEQANKDLKTAKELTDKYPSLNTMKSSIDKAQEGVNQYNELIDKTKDALDAQNEAIKTMGVNAVLVLDNCNQYLKVQEESLYKDIASGVKADKLKERYKKIKLSNEIIKTITEIRLQVWKGQSVKKPEAIEEAKAKFAVVEQNLQELKTLTKISSDLEQLEKSKAAVQSYKTSLDELLQSWADIQQLGKDRLAVANKVTETAQTIASNGMNQTKTSANTSALALSASSGIMVVGLIVAVGLGSFLAWVIVAGITKPINKIVDGLNESSSQVASASGQLSTSSQELAEGSAEQASSLEETSSTLEESASMVRQNTENTKQAALLAKQTKDSADKGNKEMQNMMKSMQELKKSSDEIAKIIKVIDEIAFQTNILALNAAVEAARAGEAGQGFAVVAEEVRNLAQRSAQAAKDTASIIESNIHLSEQGVTVSKDVNESLVEINTQAQKVSDLLDEVAAASTEQAQGIAQINKAISQMEQVVQANAATAEESAAASQQMSAQAETMNEIVNSLVALVNGANAVQEQMVSAASHRKSSLRAQVHKFVAPKSTTKSTLKTPQGTKSNEEIIPLEEEFGF
jgi:methyl-accepting chemotaxis protein